MIFFEKDYGRDSTASPAYDSYDYTNNYCKFFKMTLIIIDTCLNT